MRRERTIDFETLARNRKARRRRSLHRASPERHVSPAGVARRLHTRDDPSPRSCRRHAVPGGYRVGIHRGDPRIFRQRCRGGGCSTSGAGDDGGIRSPCRSLRDRVRLRGQVARMLIAGSCHCGNISFQLRWLPEPTEITARSCTCTFCTKHGGVWTACPNGELTVLDPRPGPSVALHVRNEDGRVPCMQQLWGSSRCHEPNRRRNVCRRQRQRFRRSGQFAGHASSGEL